MVEFEGMGQKNHFDGKSYLATKSGVVLQLFRKYLIFNVVLLIPYAFILHLGLWFRYSKVPVNEKDWIYNKIAFWLGMQGDYHFTWSMLLVSVQAILISMLVNKFKLNPDGQLFPGLVFIVLSSMHPMTAGASPAMLANLLLIPGLTQVMNIYIKKQVGLNLYNFGLFTGLASVLYLPSLWFLFSGVMALILLRGFIFREFLQILAGFFNVWFLCWVWVYFTGQESEFYQVQLKGYFSPYILNFSSNYKGWISGVLLFILFSLALLQYNSFRIKKSVIVQKYYDLMFWMGFNCLLSIFFMRLENFSHLVLWITPSSVLLALMLTRIKNPLVSETLHLIFALAALFLQIQNW